MSIYNLVKPDDVKSDIYRYYKGKSQLKKIKKIPASELAPSNPTLPLTSSDKSPVIRAFKSALGKETRQVQIND